MTRWYVLALEEPPLRPWVLAESCDECWARDNSLAWHDTVVLPAERAGVKPELASAAREWRLCDDSAYEEYLAVERSRPDGKTPEWTAPEPIVLNLTDPERAVLDLRRSVRLEVLFAVDQLTESVGPEAGRQLARMLAADVKAMAGGLV